MNRTPSLTQVERTPLHTPSSPPLSVYAVAAPLPSDDDEEEEGEDGEVDSDSDAISRWIPDDGVVDWICGASCDYSIRPGTPQ